MTHPTWQIGEVRITAFVELDIPAPFAVLLPAATPTLVATMPWLRPHWIVDDETMIIRIQAFVVESRDRRIVIDTCVGNDKNRPGAPFFTDLQTGFLTDMTAAGFGPESIDAVACTHLHIDHVGWNTRLVDGSWVPTFVNARYLFSSVEYEHWLGEAPSDPTHGLPFEDSVRPVMEAGLVDLVDPPYAITDEVSLLPTVGHTPGHCSVVVESGGERAVITGDMVHHPVQLAHPEVASSADTDQTRSTATRRAFIADVCDTDTLVIGTHFNAPTAGRIVDLDGRVVFRPVGEDSQGDR